RPPARPLRCPPAWPWPPEAPRPPRPAASARRVGPRIDDLVRWAGRGRRSLLAASRKRERRQQREQQERRPHDTAAGDTGACERAACQRRACSATFAGAVPPKLVRDATEASTVSTENIASVMRGSTACISTRDKSARSTPFASAAATSRPV